MQNAVTTPSDEAWIAQTLRGRYIPTPDECQRLEELGEKSVEPLLNALQARRIPAERQNLCERILIRIGDPVVPAVTTAYLSGKRDLPVSAKRILEQLHGERAYRIFGEAIVKFRRKPLKRRLLNAFVILTGYMLMLAAIARMIPESIQVRLGQDVLGFAILGACLIVYLSLKDWNQRQRMLAVQVCSSDRAHAFSASDINYFAPCLTDPDKQIRIQAIAATLPLLARLKPSDESALTPDTRGRLLTALDGKNVPLSLAILDALEKVGDSQAVPLVKRLAAGWGAGLNRSVKQRAKELLPVLIERASQLQTQRSLLRPTLAPEDSERLLRPAAHSKTDENALLRAASAENDSQNGASEN